MYIRIKKSTSCLLAFSSCCSVVTPSTTLLTLRLCVCWRRGSVMWVTTSSRSSVWPQKPPSWWSLSQYVEQQTLRKCFSGGKQHVTVRYSGVMTTGLLFMLGRNVSLIIQVAHERSNIVFMTQCSIQSFTVENLINHWNNCVPNLKDKGLI